MFAHFKLAGFLRIVLIMLALRNFIFLKIFYSGLKLI